MRNPTCDNKEELTKTPVSGLFPRTPTLRPRQKRILGTFTTTGYPIRTIITTIFKKEITLTLSRTNSFGHQSVPG